MRLYHGSDRIIDAPDVSWNKGFSDLGKGFYLTDDHAVAKARAQARARSHGSAGGVVSVFDFNDRALAWTTWNNAGLAAAQNRGGSVFAHFGLRFALDDGGIAAWARYVRDCRLGQSAIAGLGEPDVVCAWIATEQIEMVCAGMLEPEELAEFTDPDELVNQYCFRNQQVIDTLLAFVASEQV